MKRIAKFHKVSLEQFKKDWIDTFGLDEEANIEEIYENIKLPRRATAGSAGYDFFAPVRLILEPGETLNFSVRFYASCSTIFPVFRLSCTSITF